MRKFKIFIAYIFPICCWSQLDTKIFVDGHLSLQKVFEDTVSLSAFVESEKINWINQNYIFCGLDSIMPTGNVINVYLHKGSKSSVDIAGMRSKGIANRLLRLLDDHANNGYPFASVSVRTAVEKIN